MDTQTLMVVVILGIMLIGGTVVVTKKTLAAKNDDGKISAIEWADILLTLRAEIVDIVEKAIELSKQKDAGEDALQKLVTAELQEMIKNNKVLTDKEKKLLLSLDVTEVFEFIQEHFMPKKAKK